MCLAQGSIKIFLASRTTKKCHKDAAFINVKHSFKPWKSVWAYLCGVQYVLPSCFISLLLIISHNPIKTHSQLKSITNVFLYYYLMLVNCKYLFLGVVFLLYVFLYLSLCIFGLLLWYVFGCILMFLHFTLHSCRMFWLWFNFFMVFE